MASNLDNRYRGAGWNKDKEIKYRNIDSFEKDLIVENPVSKKIEKPKKEKLYVFEIEYIFNKFRYGVVDKNNNNLLIYNTIEFEARDKKEAKKKFDKWDEERKNKIKEDWKKDHPEENNNHWLSSAICHPEYFASITDIRKKRKYK